MKGGGGGAQSLATDGTEPASESLTGQRTFWRYVSGFSAASSCFAKGLSARALYRRTKSRLSSENGLGMMRRQSFSSGRSDARTAPPATSKFAQVEAAGAAPRWAR